MQLLEHVLTSNMPTFQLLRANNYVDKSVLKSSHNGTEIVSTIQITIVFEKIHRYNGTVMILLSY